MTTDSFDCPQCGSETETLHEGCCPDCRDSNQAALDAHNAEHDRWATLTDAQRSGEITRALRC